MYKTLISASIVGALFIGGTGLSFAADQHDQDQKAQHRHEPGHDAPHWSKTLTPEQRTEVNRMHHELDRILKPLKADEEKAHKALNQLTIKDDVKQSEIDKAIDKLMAIKTEILRHRHAHLVEMRRILTDEQRVSYDAAVSERRKIK